MSELQIDEAQRAFNRDIRNREELDQLWIAIERIERTVQSLAAKLAEKGVIS